MVAPIRNRSPRDAVEVKQWISAFGLVSGRQAIGEKYAVELASGAQISEKVVDVRAIGNDICAIAEWTVLSKKGYAATFYVREGDDWKIRMDYINDR